jgi:hypothetical protein
MASVMTVNWQQIPKIGNLVVHLGTTQEAEERSLPILAPLRRISLFLWPIRTHTRTFILGLLVSLGGKVERYVGRDLPSVTATSLVQPMTGYRPRSTLYFSLCTF